MGHVGATIDPMSTKEPIQIVREAIVKAIRDCGVEGFDLDRIHSAVDYGGYEITLALTDEQLEEAQVMAAPKPEPATKSKVTRARVVQYALDDTVLVQAVGNAGYLGQYFIKVRVPDLQANDLIEFDENFAFVRVVPEPGGEPERPYTIVREIIRDAGAEHCAPAKPCPDCAHTRHPGEYVGALERGVCLTCNGSKVI